MHATGRRGGERRVPTLIRLLFLVDVALVAAYAINAAAFGGIGLVNFLLDLDGEGSLSSWYSSIQLFLVGAALGTLACSIPGRMDRVRLWFAAALFAFLSKEEFVGIHEHLHAAMLEGGGTGSFFRHSSAWPLVLGPPLLVAMLVLGWRAAGIFRGRPGVVRSYVAGMTLFVGGAVGIELLVNFVPLGGTAHKVEVAAEECCEMVGVTFFLLGSLRLLRSYGIRLIADRDAEASPGHPAMRAPHQRAGARPGTPSTA